MSGSKVLTEGSLSLVVLEAVEINFSVVQVQSSK
jgi:hypothetical protein